MGCSPSALRTVMHMLERRLHETAAAWEQDGIAHGEIRPVIGAVDETFLQRMMLVFMDLATGYVLMEELAADRSFDTWFNRAHERLTTFGTEVLYMVSDRAKALIKLAHTGLGCPSIPDLFHLGHALAKGYSLCHLWSSAASQTGPRARQAAPGDVAEKRPGRPCPRRPGPGPGSGMCHLGNHWQEVGRAWRQRLSNLSRILHPWRLADSTRQTSKEVEEQLRAELLAIETLLATNGLPMKKDTLDKVRKQLAGISALVDLVVADGTSRLDATGDDAAVDPVG